MVTYRYALIISALLGMLFMIGVQATPVSSAPYFFRSNVMSPDGNTSDWLVIGTTVNPVQNTSAVATQGATTVVLKNTGTDYLDASLPYNPAQLGSWTITAINGVDTTTKVTHDLFGVQALPFVKNINISGDLLLTPTITWELPGTSVPYSNIKVRVFSFAGGAWVFDSNPLPINATTYTLPSGVLQPDRDYVLRIVLAEVRDGVVVNGEVRNEVLVNRSDRRFYYGTYGTPLTISRPDVYYFRRTVRQPGSSDLDQILLDAISVTPSAGTTITARSLVDNNASGPLNFSGCGMFPNEFIAILPFNSGPVEILTGGFIITASNGGAQDQVTTHNIVGVQPLAFVENVNITGNPLAPTVSWTLPAATAPFTRISVRTIGLDANSCMISNFSSPNLSTTTTTYTIPACELKSNSNYSIRIRLQDVRDGVVVNGEVRNGVLFNSSEVRVPYSTLKLGDADVNDDGAVNALDVVEVINAVLGLSSLPAADVNGDGAVNALDVVFVINRVLGL